MNRKEVKEKLKENGMVYSDMHLNVIGKKVGFFIKDPNEYYLKIDEKKFNEWLNSQKKVPEDCMYVNEAVTIYGISYQIFKFYFEKYGLEMKIDNTYSSGRQGKRYAKKSDIERVVESYHGRNKKQGEKND